MNDQDIISLHTGSIVDITALKAFLSENGIESSIRDEYASGLSAGFPNGLPGNVELFVLQEEFEKAYTLLKDFIK